MEPHARYTLVGSVVLGLIACVVFAALWISKYSEEGQFNFYTVYFRKHSLSGLQVDSDVTMRGIKIGNVSNFEISERDIQLVKVNIRVKAGIPVKTDTSAVINRNLLTGLANIDLVGSSEKAPRLEMPPSGEDYPVIAEGTTDLDQLKNSLPEVIDNANRLLARASEFVSPENEKQLSAVLTNLTSITERVAKSEDNLGKTLEEIAAVAKNINALSRSLDGRSAALSAAFEAALQSISESLGRASQKLASTMERFEDPRALIAGPDKAKLGPGE